MIDPRSPKRNAKNACIPPMERWVQLAETADSVRGILATFVRDDRY
jgi:hypothetical protein